MRRDRRRWIFMLAVALCLAAVPVAIAAFTATTTNAGNSFTASSSFPGKIPMATGSYTGNAVDSRAISTGFQADYVIVKANAARSRWAGPRP